MKGRVSSTKQRRKAEQIFADFPQHVFEAADDFYFDAADDVIFYNPNQLHTPRGLMSLLHEVAHAELAHFDYRSDLELFAMETQAWNKTRELAIERDIACSDHYIEQCLASYSRWIDARSTCPVCTNFSLQTDSTTYHCFSCKTRWHIQESADMRVRRVRLN